MAETENMQQALVPAVLTQPNGFSTSSGQLTITITLFCIIAAAFGFHFSPEQFDTWFSAAEHWATIATPIVVMLIQIFNFTNSRGKIISNTVNANAAIQTAALTGVNTLVSPGSIAGVAGGIGNSLGILHNERSGGSIQGSLLGGKNWNDPQRYQNIIADVVPFLGGLFHKKAVTSPALSAEEQAQLDTLLKKANG